MQCGFCDRLTGAVTVSIFGGRAYQRYWKCRRAFLTSKSQIQPSCFAHICQLSSRLRQLLRNTRPALPSFSLTKGSSIVAPDCIGWRFVFHTFTVVDDVPIILSANMEIEFTRATTITLRSPSLHRFVIHLISTNMF